MTIEEQIGESVWDSYRNIAYILLGEEKKPMKDIHGELIKRFGGGGHAKQQRAEAGAAARQHALTQSRKKWEEEGQGNPTTVR